MTESGKNEAKKIVVENGIEYIEKEDGLLYPNIDPEEEEERIDTGLGRTWLEFMKEKYPGRVAELRIRGELEDMMKWIDKEAWEIIFAVEKAYLASHPIIPGDFIDSVTKMQAARNCGMEQMEKEFLYQYH